MTSFDTTEIGYNPPRFWWTKRIALASVGLTGLIVALVVGATHVAQRRLDVLIESYRAKGEPVYVEDFNVFKDIPDEENAATYYKQAEVVYTWPARIDPEVTLNDIYGSVLRGDAALYSNDIGRFINTNGETIRLLKQGAQCEEAEWGVAMTQPIFNSLLPNLRASREGAKLLSIAAVDSHARGRDDQAVELMLAQMQLGQHRFAGPPCTINHLVANALLMLNCSVVEHLAAELNVASDSESFALGTASKHHVQALIDGLLEEKYQAKSFSISLASERAMLIDTIRSMGRGQAVGLWIPATPKPVAWLIRPLVELIGRRGAEYWEQFIFAAEQDTFPLVTANYPDPGALLDGGNNRLIPTAILIPRLDRAVQSDFRLRAHRRMAATALAIRLFELDRGHRPEALGELIPDFLDSIPRDPFAHGDEPIRYLPNAQPPVLYSVGLDGVDDGGKFTFRGLNNRGVVDPDKLDLVFFLNGDRPRAEP